MNLYSSPQSPARNVVDLLDYLVKHHYGEHVYRGQTREYPTPLFPSAYRSKRLTGDVYDTRSPEYEWSMRKVGKKFIGVHRFRHFGDIFLAYSGQERIHDPQEVDLLQQIGHNHRTVEAIASLGFEAAVRSVLSRRQLRRYESRLFLWESVLNRHHRALIRLNGCNELLGFPIGQTLGQHYVENSEYLDVTASPQVAAFFATYLGPDYAKPVCRESENVPDLGIIYRFSVEHTHRQEFDYYTAPPFVDALSVISRLEVPSTEPNWSPRDFVVYYLLTGGVRYWETLQLRQGIASDSRIGRQGAGFLIPDELHVEERDSIGEQHVHFQAVEDLAHRERTEKFYFRHSDADVFHREVSANSLWPEDAAGERAFLDLLQCITLSEKTLREIATAHGKPLVRMEHGDLWIPPRPEFLETGPINAGCRPTRRCS